ncbi:hypothetical protein [Bartonella sp. HY038]|uniref:hypothetical protein n=1 Tax=Bartonella sp. HY038 TaxID=2759660 RepID=UPI0015FAF6DC|nr:hypothetical protein [Bartonella sp. HY038]
MLTFLKQNGLYFDHVEERDDGVISIKNAYLAVGHSAKINIETLLIIPKNNSRFDFDISNINYKDSFEFNLNSLKISDLKFEEESSSPLKLLYFPAIINSFLNMDINQIDFEEMSLISSIGNTSYSIKFTMDAGSFEMVSKGIIQSQYFWGSAIEIGKNSISYDNNSVNLSIDHINFRDLNYWQVFDLFFAPHNNKKDAPISIAKSANIRHINYYDSRQSIDFEEVNLSRLFLLQNRETLADLINNQIAVLAMSDVERGKDGQPLVEDPLADYKNIKLMRSYFYLLDMVQAVDLDFEDYVKEFEDGMMEYQFIIKNGNISYQNNKITLQFNQIDDVATDLEHPRSIVLFSLPREWQIDKVQAENIDLANFYNLIDGEFSRLLDKDGLKKNANIDYSKVLISQIWQNFPKIDSFSINNLALYAPSKFLNDSNDAFVQIFKLDNVSLKNDYETSGPIPTKVAFEIDNFTLPKKIINQMDMPRFKDLALNVNLRFEATWNSKLNALKIDDSFIESKQLGHLTVGAEFSNVNQSLFSGRQKDIFANLFDVIVNKLVFQYEARGLKGRNLLYIAGLTGSSMNELQMKGVVKQMLLGLQLEDKKAEKFASIYDAYMHDGDRLQLKLQEKRANTGYIAVLRTALEKDMPLFWSLYDIDFISIP